ncbi:MAG: 30S ribosomal protein S15 [Nanoarchaeota archaeon]|nr:30S ribosomal protein S15 [Nanoarchaeota archaeon]
MARMHSRAKGKSGSKKPLKSEKTIWKRYKPEEVTALIEKLAKQGLTSSQIGITLRDTYGIPDVKLIINKNLTTILREQKLYPKLPEDVIALIKKSIIILKHLETNKHDQPSVRGLTLTESKIKRLAKYYKNKGLLPQSWRYSKANAKLLIE